MRNNRTALYPAHLDCGAKVVDFHGWDMPLHYGSQLQEHNIVRQDAGMFDVSHMTVVDVHGVEAKRYLQHLLANDVAKLTTSGKALYSCMLNQEGGVLDDLIAYYINDSFYRLVVNSATREKDLAWMQQQVADYDVTLVPAVDIAMIAVQGPQAMTKAKLIMTAEQADIVDNLKPFNGQFTANHEMFIAYTGYTGEQGLEIILPAAQAEQFWHALVNAGVQPCGLGARDTLRLEAGMNLYGQDMDESVSPLASGLAWTVAWQPETRDFVGRAALTTERAAGVSEKFIGLVLQGPGVIRSGQKVMTDVGEGIVTSGSFSPTMKKSIAFARVPANASREFTIEIRNKLIPARIVKLPFVRNGKILVTTECE